MTRKDFQAIATVIKDTPFTDPQDRVILAHRMAEVCHGTNPNFKKQLFLDACKPAIANRAAKVIAARTEEVSPGYIEAYDLAPEQDRWIAAEAAKLRDEADTDGAIGYIEARDVTPEMRGLRWKQQSCDNTKK
jgi:hypothetical protein